jgi:hypothetical protein
MNIQKFFTLTVKVILLLAVILIFSYVNTKKSHIEKVEKIRKGSVKEGNTGTNNTGTNNTGTNNTGTNEDNVSAVNGNSVDDKPVFVRVAEIVDRSRQILAHEREQEDADKDNIDQIQQNIEDNDYETRIQDMADNTLGFGNIIEGFGEDEEEDAKRDEALKKRQDKMEARKKAMKNQKCKYKGKTIFEFLYTCLYYLLYVFIWLAKAIYNMFDSKTKRKPKEFFDALLSPFSFIFWIVRKIFNLIVWFLVKIKDVIFYILVMIGNIIFVFVPDFLIDILSYFFAPLIILWRKISGTLFSPFGAFCWDD